MALPDIDEADSLETVAKKWRDLIKKSPRQLRAHDLYLGRGPLIAKQIAKHLAGELYVVSAGLGLIVGTELVPNYDLTVGSANSPLRNLLRKLGVTPSDWWTNLTQSEGPDRTLSGLISQNNRRLFLIALPSSYLCMVSNDLARLPPAEIKRVRIFTSSAGRANLPPSLEECALPYDDRLESSTGDAGTRSDFPQRAMRHFVRTLGAHRKPLAEAYGDVADSMAGLTTRHIPVRSRLSDEEISKMLRAAWHNYGGNSSRLLRFLRDDAQVACEQGRFRKLWQSLRAEFSDVEVTDHVT